MATSSGKRNSVGVGKLPFSVMGKRRHSTSQFDWGALKTSQPKRPKRLRQSSGLPMNLESQQEVMRVSRTLAKPSKLSFKGESQTKSPLLNDSPQNSNDLIFSSQSQSLVQMSQFSDEEEGMFSTPQDQNIATTSIHDHENALHNGREKVATIAEITKFRTICSNPFLENTLKTSKIRCKKEIGSKLYTEYEILSETSRGSFGTVYKCKCIMDGCIYAIKRINEPIKGKNHYELIMREVWALAALNSSRKVHPGKEHTIRYFDAWIEHSFVYVKTEFCSGGHLSITSSKTSAKHRTARLAEMALQIAQAVDFVHQNGVAHLDIKPQNIIETSPGSNQFKLIDFGLATMLGSKPHLDGDRRYLDPMLLQENYEDLRKSDVYGLGCTLFELFTNRPLPQEGNGCSPTLVLNELDEILPMECVQVISQMVALDPIDRPLPADVVAVLSEGSALFCQREMQSMRI